MAASDMRTRVRRLCSTRDNYRVVVEPEEPFGSDSTWQSQCEFLIKNIRRHVDGAVSAEVHSDVVCRFCGYGWAAAINDDGLPICCNEAITESDRLVQEVRDAPKDE